MPGLPIQPAFGLFLHAGLQTNRHPGSKGKERIRVAYLRNMWLQLQRQNFDAHQCYPSSRFRTKPRIPSKLLDTATHPTMKNYSQGQDDSAAAAIGVRPINPVKPVSPHAAWSQECNILPDDVQADCQNIIQGRASVGEKVSNASEGQY